MTRSPAVSAAAAIRSRLGGEPAKGEGCCVGCRLVLIQALLCLGGQAAIYHVSPQGNDAHPGTADQPFLTIGKGVATAEAGDSVWVQPGVYVEPQTKTVRGGTADARITFRAAGAVTNNGFLIAHSYITVDGFTMTGAPTGPFTGPIAIGPRASHVHIVNNLIHDLEKKIWGIYFQHGGNLPSQSAQSCLVSNNIIRNVPYNLLNVLGADHLICNNRLEVSGGDIFRVAGGNLVIRSNYVTRAGELPGGGHADLWQSIAEGSDTATNILFEQNFFDTCNSQICQMESAFTNRTGRHLTVDIRDWTFRNNLFYRVNYQANLLVPDTKWYNNLFFQCTTNVGIVLACVLSPKSGRADNTRIFNNIFLGCGGRASQLYTGNDPNHGWYAFEAGLTNCVADYNYVANLNYSGKTRTSKPPFIWREPHGVNGGIPDFVSVADKDFRLRPTSRLIDKGISLSGFTDDITGSPRPVGAGWDIGPFEYQGPR